MEVEQKIQKGYRKKQGNKRSKKIGKRNRKGQKKGKKRGEMGFRGYRSVGTEEGRTSYQ